MPTIFRNYYKLNNKFSYFHNNSVPLDDDFITLISSIDSWDWLLCKFGASSSRDSITSNNPSASKFLRLLGSKPIN
jgi:hypothetical protein